MSNILPKKSWHVYNEENKEKVRKDEEVAQVKEQRSRVLKERKSRIDELRRKVGINESNEELSKTDDVPLKTELHFSLFPEEEASILKEKEALTDKERLARRRRNEFTSVNSKRFWDNDPNPGKLRSHADYQLIREDPLLLFKKSEKSGPIASAKAWKHMDNAHDKYG